MARQPFFSGNYGSALGQIDTPHNAGSGGASGDVPRAGAEYWRGDEKYGLNKEKRIAALIQSPHLFGNEEFDKGNQTLIESIERGCQDKAELERLSGITSTLVEEDAAIAKENAQEWMVY